MDNATKERNVNVSEPGIPGKADGSTDKAHKGWRAGRQVDDLDESMHRTKAIFYTSLEPSEREEMIRIISNRLFFALLAIISFLTAGGILFWSGEVQVGATNFMVLLCGAIGGFISIQRRLKELAVEDLMLLSRSWVYVLLSPLVGGILASLLFFLFISGLLQGDLFPSFEPTDEQAGTVGLKSLFAVYGGYDDYAKLIFWCFLAGYSESFVTNIISHFESGAVPKSQGS